MAYSKSEATALLFSGMDAVSAHPDLGEEWLDITLGLARGWRPVEYLYTPDEALITRIEEYAAWCENQEGEDAGQLMEEIALLAFRCLKGCDSIKSYQSFAPQHDLVISGNDVAWWALVATLRLPTEQRTIVVEAKNLDNKVEDHQFARLCGILQNKFAQTAALGVFVTRLGASGFPERGGDDEETSRKRVLRDSYATQVLFHAKTGKYVVVLDDYDIRMLTQEGALPRILEAKIREIEECTGLPIEFSENWVEVDLPQHLLKHMQNHNPAS